MAIDTDPSTYEESNLFEQESQEVADVLATLNSRLGFQDSSPLVFSEVSMMRDMCRYDRSANPQEPSPWCSVFTKDSLKVRGH